MYAQQTANGKWRFFESYTDPLTMCRKTVSVTLDKNTSHSRKTAQDLLSAKIKKYETLSSDKKGITLRELLNAYKDAVRDTLRPQTIDRNVREIEKVMEILGPDVRADKLTARYIITKFADANESHTTKNERLKRFKAFIRWAYRMDLVPSVEYLNKLPSYEDNVKARREHKYLEPDELEKLLAVMTIDRYRTITAFAALSGMRIGEIIALKSANVDFDSRTIHVVETHSAITDEDGPTKTDGSTRDIYIQDELMDLLKDVAPGEVYFFEPIIHYDAYRAYLAEYSVKAIGRKITPHYLRHTHTSLLASRGVGLPTISRRLGHQDSRTTRDIYLHITREMKDQDNALLDAVSLLKPTRDLRK